MTATTTVSHVRSAVRPLPAGIVLLRVEDVEDLAAEAEIVSAWARAADLPGEVKDCITAMLLRVTDWLESNGCRASTEGRVS
jgi:hypothetical protein